MSGDMGGVRAEMMSLADAGYKRFYMKLLSGMHSDRMLGVRTPQLRKIRVRILSMGLDKHFMSCLPHRYYEEDQLHALLICGMGDANAAMEAVEAFLPYVDNWSTCDTLRPKAFGARPQGLFESIEHWLASGREFTVRFAIEMLMCQYLADGFDTEHFDMVNGAPPCGYYVQMMKAWYFATALACQRDAAFAYLTSGKVPLQLLRLIIKKGLESDRVCGKDKDILRELRGEANIEAKAQQINVSY